MTKKEKSQSIIDSIEWSNWKREDGTYWTTNEVLYCKIQWIKEELGEDSEHIDTLEQLESVLNLINIDKIAEI